MLESSDLRFPSVVAPLHCRHCGLLPVLRCVAVFSMKGAWSDLVGWLGHHLVVGRVSTQSSVQVLVVLVAVFAVKRKKVNTMFILWFTLFEWSVKRSQSFFIEANCAFNCHYDNTWMCTVFITHRFGHTDDVNTKCLSAELCSERK